MQMQPVSQANIPIFYKEQDNPGPPSYSEPSEIKHSIHPLKLPTLLLRTDLGVLKKILGRLGAGRCLPCMLSCVSDWLQIKSCQRTTRSVPRRRALRRKST